MRPFSRRPWTAVAARSDLPSRVGPEVAAVVVGGGIAGACAAVVLAERGVRVTLLEAAPYLGGRLGAWEHRLPDGSEAVVEHGFHGFFRHYYTWRAILRRIDPQLCFLAPLAGYPILSRSWPAEDFAALPTRPPFNLLALLARSPSFRLSDLRRMDGKAAAPLLAFDPVRSYAEHDAGSAAELLDGLRLPDRGRAMLFEVFAHSFFNDEKRYSAAEFIAMCHYYFLGNPEGLGLDCPTDDYLRTIWRPMAAYLAAHGAVVRTSTPALRLDPDGHGWRVTVPDGPAPRARHVVLALDPPALQALVAASPDLPAAAPRFTAAVAALEPGEPYTVARLWLDRDVRADRAVFSGVSREATLDSVTLYHRLERGAAQWAARTGGAVVELHSYASPPELDATAVTDRMRGELAALWPETRHARVLHTDARSGHNAPGFPPGSHAGRPGVVGDARGVRLAGDWVKLPFPSALMERAAVTGVLAANDILAEEGTAPEPVSAITPRGLLARVPR